MSLNKGLHHIHLKCIKNQFEDVLHFYVDACIKTVEDAGYKIKEYPVDAMFALGKPTPARIAFCRGVLGEEVEFFQIRD